MKVSLITVVYNGVNTIEGTIESVLTQTYKNIEYIIIDGGSADGTLGIINKYKGKIDRVISEPDEGIYDAMNKGIRLASGDIVGFLNSDDVYVYEDVIKDIVNLFENADCDGIYADLNYVDINNKKIIRKWKAGEYKNNAFLYGWMPPHPTFFVKRKIYENYGMFNTGFRTAADYELMLRFIHKYKIKIAYLQKVIIHMRIGGASNATMLDRMRANTEDRRAWEVNGLNPYFYTLYLKPLRKIFQWFV